MKCGIDEVLKLVQDSLEENVSRETFDKILQFLIDSDLQNLSLFPKGYVST